MTKTTNGTLIHGFEYQGELQTEFEMREVLNAGELFDAEIESEGAHNQLAFAGAVMARQLVRIGEFKGPFTLEQIRKLKPADFQLLRVHQGKLSGGEPVPPTASETTGTKSP